MKIPLRRPSQDELLKTYQRIEKIWDTPEYRTACKRVDSMSAHTIIGRLDDIVLAMAKTLYEYSGERDEQIRRHLLNELRLATSSLQAGIEKLLSLEGVIQ